MIGIHTHQLYDCALHKKHSVDCGGALCHVLKPVIVLCDITMFVLMSKPFWPWGLVGLFPGVVPETVTGLIIMVVLMIVL